MATSFHRVLPYSPPTVNIAALCIAVMLLSDTAFAGRVSASGVPSAGVSGGVETVKLKSAGAIEVQMEQGRRVVRFEDSVVFDYAGYHMTAGRMTLDESIGRAWAEGGVHLNGPAGYAHASRVWLELPDERFILEDLDAQAGPWSASADKAEISGDRIDLHHAVMTACPTPNPLYSLHARRLSKESPTRFVARGVVPYFYFVPFFYLPRYTYELEPVEDGDTLLPSRQGFEFHPGRGNYSGLFLRTTWRKKFFDRKLRSVSHLDYYSKPGPAVGQELQYRSPSTDHLTFAYFMRQRIINRDGFSRSTGTVNRWRLWQTWNKKFAFGHFKSFVNEASDSNIDSDYRFNLDERRLREREINAELVFDRPNFRLKLIGERLKTLNIKDSNKEYGLEHRIFPGLRLLTYPLPILPRRRTAGRGVRFYGFADALAARGRDRADRSDGELAAGRVAAISSVPITSRLSATTELGIRSEFHREQIARESGAISGIGSGRITLHRPWWGEWLQSDMGYSYQKAWTNKTFYGGNGEIDNLLFLSLRNFHRVWRTALDAGYDLRPGQRSLSTIDFQTGRRGRVTDISSIVRYDPRVDHVQSVYGNATLNLGSRIFAGLGFQSVHTDSEVQVQITPSARFETKNHRYQYGFSGSYDAKDSGWRSLDFFLTRAFQCIETTFRISKRDSDLQLNFSFRITGFQKGEDFFTPGPGSP